MEATPGVLLFDLPFGAVVPALVGPATGVHRLVARPLVESTSTVLDTPDLRLLSWGVALGRVAETGQWALRAPGWQPMLPAEQESDAAEDELPANFAAAVVPFRRGALLAPQYTVVRRRHPFHLVDAEQRVLGELSDERCTATGRDLRATTFRNLTLIVRSLTQTQLAALVAVLEAAGAVRVEEFASLGARLGLVRRAKPPKARADAPIEEFVAGRLWARWRALLAVDLAVRTAGGDDAAARGQVAALRGELTGLAPVLANDWLDRTGTLVDAVLSEQGRSILNGERYRRLLDALAEASAHPALDQVAGRQTGPVLAQELESAVQGLCDDCRTLNEYAPDVRWARAARRAERSLALADLARPVLGKPARTLAKRLRTIATALAPTVRGEEVGRSRNLQGLTPTEIFDAGRAYERMLGAVAHAREQFVADWPELWRRLRPEVIHP